MSINAARVAAQGCGWLHYVIKAMREGQSHEAAVEAANEAALGYWQRVTICWPNVKCWGPIHWVQLADGSCKHAHLAPSRPDIHRQFFELAATPWLGSALRGHVDA
jgi:hypothetical protein